MTIVRDLPSRMVDTRVSVQKPTKEDKKARELIESELEGWSRLLQSM